MLKKKQKKLFCNVQTNKQPTDYKNPRKCAVTRHLGYIEVREGIEPPTFRLLAKQATAAPSHF